MNKSICWASVDPVRCKVDFYPGFIAGKIETAYKNKEEKQKHKTSFSEFVPPNIVVIVGIKFVWELTLIRFFKNLCEV